MHRRQPSSQRTDPLFPYPTLFRSDHLMRVDYAACEVLGIQELADAFGTSAMPVREALRRLAAQQALEPMKSRSMRVPVVSRTRLEDIRRTRVLIEGTVTAWAVEHITGAMLDTLRGLAAQIALGRASCREEVGQYV